VFNSQGLLGIRARGIPNDSDPEALVIRPSNIHLKYKLDDYAMWAGIFSVTLILVIFVYCFLLSEAFRSRPPLGWVREKCKRGVIDEATHRLF
jgi:hypothetical protein